MTQTIPVVSLEQYLKGTKQEKNAFISTMGSALSEIGFFALTDHGVDSALINKAYAIAEAFFNQSEAEKRKYEIKGLQGQRGFTSFGREHAKGNNAPDLKEFWHVGREERPRDLSEEYPQNIWVTEIPQFKPTFLELYNKLDQCSMRLLEAISVYLGEEPDFLPETSTFGNSILRVIHYPPVAADANPASIRAAAHEDINLITLLCESTASGLELLQRNGKWLPIHSLKGQIIVDSGDMLQRLTNGYIRSTTHRVTNPDNSRERRFSMPFFVHPRSEVKLDALPRCIARTGGKKIFTDITAGEYLQERLRQIGLKY